MKKILSILLCFFVFLGFLIVLPSCYEFGIICSLLLFLIFAQKIYRKFGFFSLSFLYLFFFGLYGFSVPLSIIGGLDIGEYRLDYISTWDQVDDTLISFSLLNHIALIGMISAYIVSLKNKPIRNRNSIHSDVNVKNSIFSLSCTLGIFSSLFELVNFFRIGGLDILLSGKLVYQSSQADAGLILPSEIFFYMAVTACAYVASKKMMNRKKVVLFFLSISFYMLVNLIIGERGVFVNALAMFFIGYNFYLILFKIKYVYIIIGIIVYIAFAVITVYRSVFDAGIEVSVTDAVDYVSDKSDVLTFVLNPANSEFCTSTLNYRVFLNRHKYEAIDYKYGFSYIHFYSQLLPQKINLFYDKSETIKFRDEYFPERAKGGSSGGTAYSSMYEAYVNWWYFGGIIAYFLVFYLILFMEKFRLKSSTLYSFFVYVLSFELVLLYHRSAFEYIVVKSIAIFFYSYFAVMLNSFINSLKKRLI